MASNTASATSSDQNQREVNNTSAAVKPVEGLSWAEWLREHGSKLLLFARQQTRSIADAEDVLQDALIKLAKKEAEGTFDGGQASWLPYLYTSIRRCAIDLGRKEDRRGKREEKSEKDKMIQHGGVADPWFESNSADDESRTYLEAGLKQLPEKFASVITLKIWGELTFADIGKKLNISQNTAASRYRYGLEALKKHLTSAKQTGDI
ncbi:MAG: RNA polymerase sigma factor [Akkermansiaceae bacterium]